MFKNKLKKFLFNNRKFLDNDRLKIFGKKLYNPCIWYFNKHTISRGIAIGLFFAWIPVPFQMVLAAGFAILFKGNLPISVSLVWITNPITMPVLFLFAYKIGMTFFSVSVNNNIAFELSFTWLYNKMYDIWQPFLLGCIICALITSILGTFLFRIIWRLLILKYWYERKKIKK